MAKQPPLEVRLRIDFAPAGSIGPGKIDLLEAIDRSGSLSQAARDLGMSYRRAWGLLDDLNHSLGEPVASASAGGAGGGGAALTDFGRELISSYRAVETIAVKAAVRRFARPGRVDSRELKSALRRPLSRRLRKPTRATKRR
jgi:molybdate transport system regulatory protein